VTGSVNRKKKSVLSDGCERHASERVFRSGREGANDANEHGEPMHARMRSIVLTIIIIYKALSVSHGARRWLLIYIYADSVKT